MTPFSKIKILEHCGVKEAKEAAKLMREMADALDQYRGQAGRDSSADRESSRYSAADEALQKFKDYCE